MRITDAAMYETVNRWVMFAIQLTAGFTVDLRTFDQTRLLVVLYRFIPNEMPCVQ